MVSLTTPTKAQERIAHFAQNRRLDMNLTQKGLADRAGVPLSTLRKFEQQGVISLEAFLKIQGILGNLDALLAALEPEKEAFSSIDDVINADTQNPRKRGTIK